MSRKRRYDAYQSPYSVMCQYLYTYTAPRTGVVVCWVATLLIGLVLAYTHRGDGFVQMLSLFITSITFLTVLFFCVLLLWQGLGYTVSESRMLVVCMNYIESNSIDEATIDAIDAQARIDSGVSPVRALVPVLAIPIVITFLQSFELSLQNWLLAGVALSFLIVPLVLDTYQSNIDSSIRRAIIEYRYVQTYIEPQEQQESAKLLGQLLETNTKE